MTLTYNAPIAYNDLVAYSAADVAPGAMGGGAVQPAAMQAGTVSSAAMSPGTSSSYSTMGAA